MDLFLSFNYNPLKFKIQFSTIVATFQVAHVATGLDSQIWNIPSLQKVLLESAGLRDGLCLIYHSLFFLRKLPYLLICLFIYYLFWLHQVLVVACEIFVAACGLLSCSMHVASSSAARD